MDIPDYLKSNELLARLMWSRISNSIRIPPPCPDLEDDSRDPVRGVLGDEFLGWMSRETGFKIFDISLMVGAGIPSDLLPFDREAGRVIPQVVKRLLDLPAPGRRALLMEAKSLASESRSASTVNRFEIVDSPTSFGSLLVRMLALRNLGWSSGARVMYLMSGTYVSAATIGAVGRGAAEIDAKLLDGFSAVLGVPLSILSDLTGVHIGNLNLDRRAEVIDAADLIWIARFLNGVQMRKILSMEC